MFLFFMFLYIFGGTAFLIIYLLAWKNKCKFEREDAEKSRESAEKAWKGNVIRAMLLNSWESLKNDQNRVAVLALSEAIQRLGRGVWVKPSFLIYILSQLDGTDTLIKEIKGMGA